jgi:hypothetical protein
MFGFKKQILKILKMYIYIYIYSFKNLMCNKKIIFLFKLRKHFVFNVLHPKNAIHFPSLAFILRERVIFSKVFVKLLYISI